MTGRRALDAALLLLLVALGCSALVDPRNPEPRCEQEDGGARVCPEGLACVQGRCQRACGMEVCANDIDDDCDGQIDEADALGREYCGDQLDNDCDNEIDEGSDFDGDGYSWCGNTTDPDAALGSVDCDDRLTSVHPGLPETCDGQDNDCDGKVDEANAGEELCESGYVCASRCVPLSCSNEGPRMECAADERCDAASGQCVPRTCGSETCTDDEVCDAVTSTCRPRQPMQNGSPCATNGDCVSGSCIDGNALRFAKAGRVCGEACCDDGDCPEGQRCFASGSGARSCLPAAMVPLSTPTECTTNESCPAFFTCGLDRAQSFGPPQYLMRSGVVTPNCLLGTPAAGVGSQCATFAQCATRVCVPGQFFGSVCSNPCGSSLDCRDLKESVGGLGAYCRYVDVTLESGPTDYAAVCVVRRASETGRGVYGAACSTGADCLEGGCVEATASQRGRCSPSCCNDSQCGPREDGKPIPCRPFAFGDRYEMRCDI
ncbi:MAG TPA: putative metal-binding motif-containing protein [Polyangiales bacterium]|nr:putative metal-binding motif-containing protein [Polyangiales bacterium]